MSPVGAPKGEALFGNWTQTKEGRNGRAAFLKTIDWPATVA